MGCIKCPSNCSTCNSIEGKLECTACSTTLGTFTVNSTTKLCEAPATCPAQTAKIGVSGSEFCAPCGPNAATC